MILVVGTLVVLVKEDCIRIVTSSQKEKTFCNKAKGEKVIIKRIHMYSGSIDNQSILYKTKQTHKRRSTGELYTKMCVDSMGYVKRQ